MNALLARILEAQDRIDFSDVTFHDIHHARRG